MTYDAFLEQMKKDLEFDFSTELRRAVYQTINSVVDDIDRREDFAKIRCCGRKSANEIMLKLFLYTYENLRPEKRNAYLAKVRKMN